jgi:pentatricopeptide repeat protein
VNLNASTVTYSTVIDGLMKNGKSNEAIALLHEMKELGIPVNTVTYNSIIDGLMKAGKTEEAVKVLLEMKAVGVIATTVTYTSIIDGLMKAGKTEEAMKLLLEMKRVGVVADTVTYTSIIDGLMKGGKTEEAMKMLLEMKETGAVVNAVTYTTIIDGLMKAGKTDDAMKMLLEMKTVGVIANTVTYTSIIGGLCKGQSPKLDQVRFLLDSMEAHGPEPNVRTYAPVISSLAFLKNYDACFQIILRMEKRGLGANYFCFAPLLRSRNVPAMEKTLRWMIERKAVRDDKMYGPVFADIREPSVLNLYQQWLAVAVSANQINQYNHSTGNNRRK